ncbi:hypothetical protein BURPS1655_L0079 [Burkholderia pseudomallei 1655]|nr:hypothetical protein BURPS1655_L0079 [Burkholderia pseudomallei 1655]
MRVIPIAPRIVRARPFDRCVARVRSDHQLNRRVRHSSVFLMCGTHGCDDRVRTPSRSPARVSAMRVDALDTVGCRVCAPHAARTGFVIVECGP